METMPPSILDFLTESRVVVDIISSSYPWVGRIVDTAPGCFLFISEAEERVLVSWTAVRAIRQFPKREAKP